MNRHRAFSFMLSDVSRNLKLIRFNLFLKLEQQKENSITRATMSYFGSKSNAIRLGLNRVCTLLCLLLDDDCVGFPSSNLLIYSAVCLSQTSTHLGFH